MSHYLFFINVFRSKSILMDFKLCSNCADVFYALDNEKDPEQWHVFNIEDVQTPQSIRWHLIRNIWLSQTAEINIGKYEESTINGEPYASMVYYSHGTEEHATYVNMQKEKFGVDHVHIHTLRRVFKLIQVQ